MSILICGGSHGYGADLGMTLRRDGHAVYLAQRGVIPGMGIDPVDPVSYEKHKRVAGIPVSVNFSEPTTTIQAVSWLRENSAEQFTRVVNAVASRELADPHVLTALEISEGFLTNLFSPLMFLLYLKQFGLLAAGCKVFCLIDRQPVKMDQVVYHAAKRATPVVFDCFHSLFEGMPFYYVTMPAASHGDDLVTRSLARLVENGPEDPRQTMIDLRSLPR